MCKVPNINTGRCKRHFALPATAGYFIVDDCSGELRLTAVRLKVIFKKSLTEGLRPTLVDFEAPKKVNQARRLGNVTGLWGEMRAVAICRPSQKMSDNRVAHIFRPARAFTPKPQRIAQSPCARHAEWSMQAIIESASYPHALTH